MVGKKAAAGRKRKPRQLLMKPMKMPKKMTPA